jgi:CLIP-associating protein 1/2
MSGDGFELDVLAPSASILPIRTHSERDLDKEMEAVGHALRSTDAAGAAIDWTKRLGALRRLQGLVLGGAANVGADAPSALLASLKPLREAMSAQLSDLRSQIIREACVTLKLLAGALGEAFAEHVDFFFDKLLRQTGVTILIISRSAHACMCELIARTRPVRSAPRVAAALADRSTAVRIRAIEYFELLARVIPPPAVEGERGPLDRHADILLAALRPALRDAVAEVRAIARAAFWALHAHLPAQCRALLESSDAQTQRLLRDEEASAAADRRQPAAHASRASAESAREGSGGGGASGGGELHANPASKPRADGGAAVRHLAHAARAGHAEHAPAARPGAARGTGAAATAADGRRKRDAAGEAGAPAGGGGLGGAIRVAPPAARGGGTAAERELPLGGLTRRPPSAASGARRVVVALAAPTAPARDAASDRQAHAAPPVPSGGALPKPACRALAPELDAQLQSMDVGSCAASVAPPPSHPPPAAALAHAPPPSPPAAHASQAQPAGASAARVANELSQSPQEPAMPQEPQLAAPPPQLKPAPPPALQQQPGTPPKRQPHKPTTPGRSPRAAVGAAAAAVVSADQGLSSVWIGQMCARARFWLVPCFAVRPSCFWLVLRFGRCG